MLAIAPIMVAESKLATTDATLAFWLVGCQFCLWELARRPSQDLAGLFWVCLSLAILTKGPIGPVFLLAVGGRGLVVGLAGRTGLEAAPFAAGLARLCDLDAALVSGRSPWSSRGEFLRFAVGNADRPARPPARWKSTAGFPGYYLVCLAAGLLSLVGARSGGGLGGLDPAEDRSRAWLSAGLGDRAAGLLLECFQTKLIHYYLPAFPACALLVAWLVETVAAEEVSLRRWPLGRLGLGLLVGIGLAGTVGLLAAAVTRARAAAAAAGDRCPLMLGAGTLAGMLWFHAGRDPASGPGTGRRPGP